MTQHSTVGAKYALTHGSSVTRSLIETMDWSESALGPHADWPDSLRRVLDLCLASSQPTVLLWGTGLVQFFNDAYRALFEGEEVSLGQSVRELPSPLDSILAARIDTVMSRGEGCTVSDLPLSVVTPRGCEQRYFSVSYTPVFDDGGRVGGVFVTMADSTDKVVAEQTYRELLSLISHDLKSPLSTILVGTALIDRRCKEAAESLTIGKHTATIRRSADRMARLVADVADYAKLRSGRLPMEKATARVREIVDPVTDAHRALAAQKQQSFSVDVQDAEAVLVCDAERVRRALGNVLGNALKFTPEGGHIALRVAARGPAIIFRVADSGPGIAEEERAEVFERRHGRVRRMKGEGPGLGMPIARAIVEAHGGVIAVEPSDSGATVAFSIPTRNPAS